MIPHDVSTNSGATQLGGKECLYSNMQIPRTGRKLKLALVSVVFWFVRFPSAEWNFYFIGFKVALFIISLT